MGVRFVRAIWRWKCCLDSRKDERENEGGGVVEMRGRLVTYRDSCAVRLTLLLPVRSRHLRRPLPKKACTTAE